FKETVARIGVMCETNWACCLKRKVAMLLATQTAHAQGLAAIIGVDGEGFGRLYAVSFGGHDDYLLKAWVLKSPIKTS
ncbi:MAG: hypothetical protein EBY76_06190, partial [Betaproteobacteria bacterium]|nr:hypothetical protein [Betaproteobacteria bacterium]